MNKKKLYTFLTFTVIFVVAILLRIKAIPNDGLWFDELYSVWVASGKFPSGILERLYTDDAHAPLYHFILHFYMKFFGNSAYNFQIFNLCISMLAFPVVYFLGTEVAGGKNNENAHKFGLFAILLLCFNYFHIAFSQETRFYNMTGVLLSLSTLFLFKQINNGYKLRYLFGVLIPNILMCYTITPGCIYVFIQALVFGVYFLNKKRELIKPLAISSLATFLFYIPYIPFVFHQFETSHNSFMGAYAHSKIDPVYVLENFCNWFAQTPMVYTQIRDILDLSLDYNRANFFLLITEIALLIMFLYKSFTLKEDKNKLIFTLLASFCVFHLIFFVLHLAPYMPRYNLAFMPLIVICFAGALNSIQAKWVRELILIFLIVPGTLYLALSPYKTSFMKYGRMGPGIRILKSYNLTPDDRIFKTHSAKLLPPMGVNATPIDVCLNATFLFYNPRRLEMIFGDDYLKYKKGEDRENYINDYIFDPNVNVHNRNYYNKQIEEMKKGSRIAIWLLTSDNEYNEFRIKYDSCKNCSREVKNALIEDFKPQNKNYRYTMQKIEEDYGELITHDKRLKIIDGQPLTGSSILLFEKVKD